MLTLDKFNKHLIMMILIECLILRNKMLLLFNIIQDFLVNNMVIQSHSNLLKNKSRINKNSIQVIYFLSQNINSYQLYAQALIFKDCLLV
jgi:hypothetical protein